MQPTLRWNRASLFGAALLAGLSLSACDPKSSPVQNEAEVAPSGAAQPTRVTVRPLQEPVQVTLTPVLKNGKAGGEPRQVLLTPVSSERQQVELTPVPR